MNHTNNNDMLVLRLVMRMNEQMTVGERIRYYRILRGMSQETLALEANINAAFVGHLERGLKSPTVTTLEKITEALGISMGELFSEELSRAGKRDRKRAAFEHIEYMLRDLTDQEAEQLAGIIQQIMAFSKQ